MVAAALALVLAIGGGTVVVLKKRAAHAAAVAAEAGEEAGSPAESAQPDARGEVKVAPVYLPLDPFVVNLADKEADRYAQIGITLEVESSAFADQMKTYMPAIRNSILMIVAHKTSRDLLDRPGKEQLAEEIMREAVRPMGIEIAAPEPVSFAPAAAASAPAAGASGAVALAASDAASRPRKLRKRGETTRNPIQHVHFSSFIIQ
jgi:flagellar FliL protein